jgi:precorrin-6A synthase
MILLIGIGAGDPDYVTVQAVKALNAFDVLFVVTKDGADDLVAARREIVDRHRTAGPYRVVELADPPRPWREAPDYPAAVERWREQREAVWREAVAQLGAQTGAFLVWGDPSLYESTLAIVQRLGIDYDVIPGISAVHALTARHRIPLNRVGRPVHITPARLLDGGLPADDVVVMLDAGTAFAQLPPEGIEIYWGAYLGTADEILVSGPLGEVADEIVRARAEARERKGWIFDTYLLRRT